MKKSLIALLPLMAILSCGSPAEEKKAEEPATTPAVAETQPPVQLPYSATYSADWKIGDPANVKIVMDLYKAVEENKIDEFDKYLADTVTATSFDAEPFRGSKQDVIKKVKDLRSQFKTVSEEFLSYVPLHCNDRNEDWVATWVTERVTRNDGSKDSTVYQETWRFKDGKIYYKGGFARYKPRK